MSTSRSPYHHGDLRAACLHAALELLEEGGATALSLRAVARRAGVSPTAPYRHYADRDALVSAVAAVGYRELAGYLAAAHPSPSTPDELADVAVAYVQFALQRPALFRVMFAEPCDPGNAERVAATAAITQYVDAIVRRSFPGSDLEAMSTAVWALVHGLAFLYLDGKLDSASAAAVSARVRAAVHALLEISGDELGSSEPMELRHLEHFVAIAQEGSFTQAAKRLHLSQSALSISIRALEKDLGARLFERTSHEVALSDAGRALLPEARRILSDVDVARAAVGDVGSGLRGVFRVGVMQALPLVDLAEILARFHAERPLVEIRPRPAAGGSAALAEDVSKGELDAAFVCLPGRAPAGVTLTPLAAEPIRLVCRPDHPLAGRTSVAISELEKEGFVDFPAGFGTREAVDMEFARAGVEHIVKVEVPDLTTMIELTRAGIGMATLPLSLLIGRGRLAVVDLESAPPFEVALALPSARPVKAATQAFLDVVAEICPGMDLSR